MGVYTVAAFKGGVGKTTSAIHLAAYLSERGTTLLVDGDPNHSASGWRKRGELPFKVVDLIAASKYSKLFEHIVIDTAARPSSEDIEALADGCDLLILPTTPDALAMDALMQTVDALRALGSRRYRILLTMVPPPPRQTGQQARDALIGLPLFKHSIRRFAAYEKAALEGKLVFQVNDRNARIAWRDYQSVGAEL